MSEDITKIGFRLLNDSKNKYDIVTDLITRYAKENGCKDIEILKSGVNISVNIEFCSFDDKVLQNLLMELQSHGADNPICSVWVDNVGEELYFAIFENKLLMFESLDSLNDYKVELANASRAVDFDFGKDKRDESALIRLYIKAKGKRKKICELFERYCAAEDKVDIAQFSKDFIAITKSNTHDVKWCAFKWKKKSYWFEGPENLILGLKFSVERDDFVYLGFDLEGLDIHANRSPETDLENLILILSCIDGVKKTWIKFRPEQNTVNERYIYHPGMGDEPMVLYRTISEDSEWPK